VPWNALALDETEHKFILNVDRPVLQNAPGFDEEDWPDTGDPDWGSQIDTLYGEELRETGTESGTPRPREKTLTGGGGL
jgi:hypothetical protein